MTVYKQPNSPYWLIELEVGGRRRRCSSKTTPSAMHGGWNNGCESSSTSRSRTRDQPALSLGEALDRYPVLMPRSRARAADALRGYLHDRIKHDLGADTPMRLITAAAIANFSEALLRKEKPRPP